MYKVGISYQPIEEIMKHDHLDDLVLNVTVTTPFRTRQSAVKYLLTEMHITQCITICGSLDVLEGAYNRDGTPSWGHGVIEHFPDVPYRKPRKDKK